MSDYDYIIVGSGINALIAAAVLGKKGARSSCSSATPSSAAVCAPRRSRRPASFTM